MSGILDKPIVITVSARGSTGPQGETGNGIESISLLSESGLTKTYRITFTDGTHFDFAVSDGNGISGIEKTSTVGLVDTYTITYTDGTTATFTVTNGAKGDKGDKGNTGNGIASIAKTGTSGLVDTYTITFTDGNTTTFTVTNGNAILSVSKTSTSGLTDTYTITFSDGTSTTYVVTNGKGIATIAKTSVSGLVDTYTITYNDDTTSTFTVTNGNGIASVEKTATVGLVDTYTITFTDGTNTTFEVTNGSDTWGAITGNIDDQADLHNALAGKAVAIEESLSGPLVTIEDGADGIPVKSLTVAIDPVQDLHGYDAPWPAGGGKNLLNPNIYSMITDKNGLSTTVKSDNVITLSGTASANTYFILNQTQNVAKKTSASLILPAGTYTFSARKSDGSKLELGGSITLYYWYENDENEDRKAASATSQTYTSVTLVATETVYVSPSVYIVSGRTTNFDIYFQFEAGSSATSFAPYSNICPISGWTGCNVYRTGKNLYNPQYKSTNLNNKYFTFFGVTSGTSSQKYKGIFLKAGVTYTFTVDIGSVQKFGIYASWKNSNSVITIVGNSETRQTHTWQVTPDFSDNYVIWLYSSTNWDEMVESADDITLMISAGNATVDYVAPNPTTLSIDFPSEAGTVYGGTLDVTTGVLTVKWARHAVTSDDVTVLNSAGTNAYRVGILQEDMYPVAGSERTDMLCNIMKPADTLTRSGVFAAGECMLYSSENSRCVFFAVPSEYNSGALAKQYLVENGCEYVYPLAEPVTYQLTGTELWTLLGNNVIYADTGDVTVTYRADTKSYIDQQLSARDLAIKSLMTAVESSMTLTANRSSGDVVIVGDVFYKLTTNVASGSTLVVGTNCVVTTMAEWIISLQS